MTRTTAVVVSLLIGAALPANARILIVRPGHSIQAAVDSAKSGDTVLISPGTYHEAGRPCPLDPANTCAVTGNGVRPPRLKHAAGGILTTH